MANYLTNISDYYVDILESQKSKNCMLNRDMNILSHCKFTK